jgi:hypothetical protein
VKPVNVKPSYAGPNYIQGRGLNRLRNPVYGSKLYVGVGVTAAECSASLPACISVHLKDDLPSGTDWSGHTFDINGGVFVILLRADRAGNVPYDSIFHEVAHATAWMCKYHGVKVDPEDHEAYAYLQGWVGAQTMKAVLTYKKRAI